MSRVSVSCHLGGSCTWGRGCWGCGSSDLRSPPGGNQQWGGGIGEVSELGGLPGLCPGVALSERGAVAAPGGSHTAAGGHCMVPPQGGGSMLSTHSPWATAAARCCLCSCLQLCPSAHNLRLLLCLVCVRGARGCVRDTGGWLGRAAGCSVGKRAEPACLCCVCVGSASAELRGRAEPRGPPRVCDLVALLCIKHHMVEKKI